MNYWEKLGLLMDQMDIEEFEGTKSDEDLIVELYMRVAEDEDDSNEFIFTARERELIDKCLKENNLDVDEGDFEGIP